MAVTWVATHTGLPSFYSDTPVRITAGARVIADGTGPVWVSDALATPGQATTYKVGGQTVKLTRRDPGHALTDIWGRRMVRLDWLGDDPEDIDPRLALFEASARRTPAARWALHPATPTGTLSAVTEGYTDTMTMKQLVGGTERTPVAALHSKAMCQVPECDIPQLRLVYVTGVSSVRSGRVDVAEREWSLPYRATYAVDIAAQGRAPIVTYGEWSALGEGWKALSAVQVAQRVAGMPG